MSKKSKARSKLKRLQQKQDRKAARKALYEAYKKAGQNTKSKRFRVNQKKVFKNLKHAVSFCGNLGCNKCHPEFSHPKFVKKNSCIYRLNFTSSKFKLHK